MRLTKICICENFENIHMLFFSLNLPTVRFAIAPATVGRFKKKNSICIFLAYGYFQNFRICIFLAYAYFQNFRIRIFLVIVLFQVCIFLYPYANICCSGFLYTVESSGRGITLLRRSMHMSAEVSAYQCIF